MIPDLSNALSELKGQNTMIPDLPANIPVLGFGLLILTAVFIIDNALKSQNTKTAEVLSELKGQNTKTAEVLSEVKGQNTKTAEALKRQNANIAKALKRQNTNTANALKSTAKALKSQNANIAKSLKSQNTKTANALKRQNANIANAMKSQNTNIAKALKRQNTKTAKALSELKGDICRLQLSQQGGQVIQMQLMSHKIDPYDLVVDGKENSWSHLPVRGTFSFGLISNLSKETETVLRGINEGVTAYTTNVHGVLSLSAVSKEENATREGFPVVVGSAHTVFYPKRDEFKRFPIAVPPSLAKLVKAVLVAKSLFKRGRTCIGEELFCFVLEKFPEGQEFVYDLSSALCSTPNASQERTPSSAPAAPQNTTEDPSTPVSVDAVSPDSSPAAQNPTEGTSAERETRASGMKNRDYSGTQHPQRVQFTAGLSNSIDPSGQNVLRLECPEKGRYYIFVGHRFETGNSGTLMLGMNAAGEMQGILGAFYGATRAERNQQRGLISPFLKDRSQYVVVEIEPTDSGPSPNGAIVFQTTMEIESHYPNRAAQNNQPNEHGSFWDAPVLWTDEE